MTDFAPNVTPRYKINYRSAGINHSVQFRAQRGTNPVDGQNAINTLLQDIVVALNDWLPTDFAAQSSVWAVEDDDNFTIPLAPPTFTPGTVSLATYSPFQRITEVTWKGTGGGSKVSFGLFGVFVDQHLAAGFGGNGRIEKAEQADFGDTITALQSQTFTATIAGVPAHWYNYVTVKPNDHWVKKVRQLYP